MPSIDIPPTTAIPLLTSESAPLLVRPYLEGETPSVLAALFGHVPEIAETMMPAIATIFGPSQLGERLKNLVILRMSARNGCGYCTAIYRSASSDAGFDAETITAVIEGSAEPNGLSEREQAALTLVDLFESNPERGVAVVTPHFRHDEIIALLSITGMTAFLNRFARGVGLR